MRRLHRLQDARNWRIRAGRCAPRGCTRSPGPRGRRLPLEPSPAARAMGGESAHPCFGRRPVEGANGACSCLPSELPGLGSLTNFARCCHMVPAASPNTQTKRGHAVRAAKHRGMFLPIWWGQRWGGLAVGSQLVGLGSRSNFAFRRMMVPTKPPSTNINCTPAPRAVFTPLFLAPQICGARPGHLRDKEPEISKRPSPVP
jgi:hypothetical protein